LVNFWSRIALDYLFIKYVRNLRASVALRL
jgi:hypothetical protein